MARKPEQREVRVLFAFAYLKQNLLDNAERLLEREIELDPESHIALTLLADVHYRQGRAADAESVCLEHVGTLEKEPRPKSHGGRRGSPRDFGVEGPNVGLPNFILGMLDKQQGRFASAIGNFGLAREIGYDQLACHLHSLDAEAGRQAWESGSTWRWLPRSESAAAACELHEHGKAKECFDEYISLGGDEAKVKEILLD